MRFGVSLIALALAVATSSSACTSIGSSPYFGTPAPIVVAVQPYGRVDAEQIETVVASLKQQYEVEIVALPERALPQAAYYKPRNRYRATILLEDIDATSEARFTKIIGVTASDISVTKFDIYDWGIFGLGSVGGRACVVSSFRFGHGKANAALRSERLRKVAIHEVGHTFGLPHCPNEGCVMRDAAGTISEVDRETEALCSDCREQLSGVVELKDRADTPKGR